jgi:hypothetical protein
MSIWNTSINLNLVETEFLKFKPYFDTYITHTGLIRSMPGNGDPRTGVLFGEGIPLLNFAKDPTIYSKT